MDSFKKLNDGDKELFSTDYFSGEYNHELYIKKSKEDGSKYPKFYILVYSKINGELIKQGYLYFYLDYANKASYFIGLKVEPQFRNLNIGSFLIANWIDLCLNNGYDILGTNDKQRKPFLLYLLKTYGFEILDKSLYSFRPDVISICRSSNFTDNRKFLLFRDSNHEDIFTKTNVYKTDNYEIIHNTEGFILLDNIILPLQSRKRNQVHYELLDYELAETKVDTVINKHKK